MEDDDITGRVEVFNVIGAVAPSRWPTLNERSSDLMMTMGLGVVGHLHQRIHIEASTRPPLRS
jgi:putative tricarboxylic transport membrane protein